MLVSMANLWEETHCYQNLGEFSATKEHVLIGNNNVLNYRSFAFMINNKIHWVQKKTQ